MGTLIRLGHGVSTGLQIANPQGGMVNVQQAFFGRDSSVVNDQILNYTVPSTTALNYTRHSADTCQVTHTAWTNKVLVEFTQSWNVSAITGQWRTLEFSLGLYRNGSRVTAGNGASFGGWGYMHLGFPDEVEYNRVAHLKGAGVLDVTPGTTYTFQMRFAARSILTDGTAAPATTARLGNRSIEVFPTS